MRHALKNTNEHKDNITYFNSFGNLLYYNTILSKINKHIKKDLSLNDAI